MAGIPELPAKDANAMTNSMKGHWRSVRSAIAAGTTPGTSGNFAKYDTNGNLADSLKAVPAGNVVGTTDAQTLTNKTMTQPGVTLKPINASKFTCAAAANTVVTNTEVNADSMIVCFPMNQAAANLQNTRNIFVLSIAAGVSFTVRTQDGVAAAGTEIFSYLLFNN